ncbi:MAG TPA: chloride channel protein [Thermomicrobiaceae bacterium]|nr:chloride channel protein [Thermomicrobiaceae bacterium]
MADEVRPPDVPRSLRSALLRRLGWVRTGTTSPSRYFARWAVLGVLVGIAAGLGAIVFFWLLQTGTHLFLGRLAGYAPPAPLGEGNHGASSLGRPWVLPLVVALGGLLSGLLVFTLAPEAEGHGTDAAIDAFHHKGGRVRARVIPVKTLASAITIGSGGSAGREGPTAQISAGVGSLLGQWLGLDPNDRRILLATGTGAGIGAIFRAPLGGAVLAAEILYTHDMEIEALFPGLIASIVGYTIFGAWAGWEPIFGAQPLLGFTNPIQLLYYAALGLICGFVGVLYAKTFYGVTDIFHRLQLPNWFKPVIGGALVGLLGLVLPEVLGTGYGWLQEGLGAPLTISLWALLLLPFAKILATSLSIGSGGSGGIFGPGMVIGGTLGTALWQLSHTVLPGMPESAAPFTIVAMAALFGGIAHAPLAVMLMVGEMTGNLSLLAPAMIAVGLATLVTGDHTIYTSQLPTRADSPAHRYQFSFPLLNTLSVRDAIGRALFVFTAQTPVAEAERQLLERNLPGAPVVNERHQLAGVVTMSDIATLAPEQRPEKPVAAIMTRQPVAVDSEASLDVALELLATNQVSWAPVVEARDQVVGVITAADIVATYRTALRWTVRRLHGITADTVLLESRIAPDSPLAGKALRELHFPGGALVVSIHRAGATVLPRGSSTLEAGDLVAVLTSPESEASVRDFLGGTGQAHPVSAGFS